MLVALIIFVILLASLAVFAFFYMQVKKNRRSEGPSLEGSDSMGDCARCGQRRLIVSKREGLCAFCWSALRTKQN
jgi:hypothetical protein